jgi:hypothetical protein
MEAMLTLTVSDLSSHCVLAPSDGVLQADFLVVDRGSLAQLGSHGSGGSKHRVTGRFKVSSGHFGGQCFEKPPWGAANGAHFQLATNLSRFTMTIDI